MCYIDNRGNWGMSFILGKQKVPERRDYFEENGVKRSFSLTKEKHMPKGKKGED